MSVIEILRPILILISLEDRGIIMLLTIYIEVQKIEGCYKRIIHVQNERRYSKVLYLQT